MLIDALVEGVVFLALQVVGGKEDVEVVFDIAFRHFGVGQERNE